MFTRRSFLNSGLGVAALGLAPTAVLSQRSVQPNFIVMLSDDQGWDETSAPMDSRVINASNRLFHTPSLSQMAAEGMRFSRAYSPSPVCAPARASLQTGKSPAQLNWTKVGGRDNGQLNTPNSARALDVSDGTVASMLGSAGYLTGHFGKWHLEGGGPSAHGYQISDGNLGNAYARDFNSSDNPVDLFGMAQRAEAFMASAAQSQQPFYLQMSFHALHQPRKASAGAKAAARQRAEQLGVTRRRSIFRAALAEDMDQAVGRVLRAVARLGLASTTYILFTSDNGPGANDSAGPLRGGKGSVFEAGIRVPMIVRGPKITAGSEVRAPVSSMDVLPTCLSLAKLGTAQTSVEGGDLSAVLSGRDAAIMRPDYGLGSGAIAFHFPHYQDGNRPMTAVVNGDWKTIYDYEAGAATLYNLTADPGEQRNLAPQYTAYVGQQTAAMFDYLKRVGAGIPG